MERTLVLLAALGVGVYFLTQQQRAAPPPPPSPVNQMGGSGGAGSTSTFDNVLIAISNIAGAVKTLGGSTPAAT
jgi:hypothetical protein